MLVVGIEYFLLLHCLHGCRETELETLGLEDPKVFDYKHHDMRYVEEKFYISYFVFQKFKNKTFLIFRVINLQTFQTFLFFFY